MSQISGQNEKFLRREFVVPTIFEIMDPYLVFLDIIPKIKADARAITYKQEPYSNSTDPKKKTPRARSPSSKWAYVEISQMEQKAGILNRQGIAVKVDEDAIDFVEGIDEIQRAYNKVGFWLAENLNSSIATALIAGATTPTWTPVDYWSNYASTASPVKDLIALEEQMEREGYPYRFTDAFVNKTNWYELKQYLTAINVADGKQSGVLGMPETSKSIINVPVVGVDIHKLLSGIDEGGILALDRNNPAGTLFYNNSPRYSTETVSYKTRDGAKSVPNFGFNFNQYTDPETHEVIMQFWFDQTFVVKEPYAVLYDTGI